MEILKFHEILSYCRFKNFLSISFISFNFKINEFRFEATKKKRRFSVETRKFFASIFSRANISANVSREPRRTESTSISKIEPFDGASPIIMPFDFDPLSDLAPPPPPCIPCAPLAAPKAFSSNVFRTNVSFLPPTFPRPSPLFFHSTHPTRPTHPHLHRGISIYLLVFKSRLVSNEIFAISRRMDSKFTNRNCLFRDRSIEKENFILSNFFFFLIL